jgi:hypothetical protein
MLVLDNPKSAHIGPISYLGRSRRVPHEEKMGIPRQRRPGRLSLEYVIDVPHDVLRDVWEEANTVAGLGRPPVLS